MQLRLDAADRLVELVEERRGPALAEQRLEVAVLLAHVALERLAEAVVVEEIGHADAGARDLVLVGGPDAPARGADLARAAQPLASVVDRPAVGEDQVRLLAHAQPA